MNQKKELNKRTVSYGVNSVFITLVVLALIGVINFLSARYPQKFDLTKNKIHTFSDQSAKVMAGLKTDLTATLYGDLAAKEKYLPIIDNYKRMSPKFKFELVDPNKEPTRAKQAGIKKMETLILGYEGRTTKVEDITEEKITNEIIKMTKGTRMVVCTITGHGEQSFSAVVSEGLSAAKKGLEDQSYEVKELNLPQQQSIPADCTGVIMMGANKALFPTEVKVLSDYLDNGGRVVMGVEAAVTGPDETKELKELLKSWGVEIKPGLVIDPVSRMLGVDASVPIVAQFNGESAITKDFKQQCYFPFTRPVDVTATPPEGLKTTWLAKTTPKAWGEMDLKSIAKGEVQYNQGVDVAGPITTGVVVSGKKKDSKATRETRLVVFGSAQFANNNYARFGGNQDLFLNSVSWVVEDESLISIRTKEEDAGKIELSQTQGLSIFWISVIIVPMIIAIMGIVIWVRRKKL